VIKEQENNIEIVLVDKIIVPKSLETPEQLKFLRSTLRDIINENDVKYACIRITESNARQVNIPRIYLEGVAQELIASSTVEKYYIGQISSISAKLGIDRAEFKPYISGQNLFMEMEIWSDISLEERESIMAAVSALNQ
jgi:Holliday junction resolvasome RuvABC endonuclease subunit